ncbi:MULTISPECIES: geranylgeranylglycerol-phosphate geranylgeranyltransferase [unclassified Leeuwenhoekiella]|uniref:geranylgeranylglycerol-phosphate geranylgeranyltransferase n=1 Tax=unclassified Leeuwenhoekiella TaxID=2615029 RepID=UPI000C351C15|nr:MULTISPECIES: geranylgeranylglycerol-phosphate geranylgeranyltransferase [unclassified Leeuwenhoekiella]MBA80486.1 ubiquinone biosynthesis protein UbiA [Leeuwenhoekiella sp.]|tara:strand:- start:76047 stop:76958 length:912 start_codon:yes stop_codon:yes gene_type:complete
MSHISRKNKLLLLKFLSLFSVVRGYNILIIVIAQYLASVFILSPDLPLRAVIFDLNLFLIVLATALVIAGGYIINSFYDSEKDLINRPQKTKLDHLVSQKKILTLYFVLNFLAVVVASYVSFFAVLFFSGYIFGIWFYSHKLKKIAFIGNLTSASLALTPFFAVFIYYRNFETVIFVHATFLGLIIMMRELTKDLENLKGDLALGYHTIPIAYGERSAKAMITLLVGLTVIPTYLLIKTFDVGLMNYYFYGSLALLLVYLFWLWNSRVKLHYLLLHNILKLILVLGVFSILLIKPDLVIDKIF